MTGLVTLLIPSLDTHCTSRYSTGSAFKELLTYGGNAPKCSSDWQLTALYPFWHRAQIRKPKNMYGLCF